MIECARPPDQSATFYDENDSPVVVSGALALAPEWQSGPPSADGAKGVSACLAARTNAAGQAVRISIRAANGLLTATDRERGSFRWAAGALWGDLCAATPYI